MVEKFSMATYANKNRPRATGDAASHLFRSDRDLSGLELKPDHQLRPIWLDAANGNAPALDTALPGADAPAEDHSEHAGHGGSGGASADADPADFDAA